MDNLKYENIELQPYLNNKTVNPQFAQKHLDGELGCKMLRKILAKEITTFHVHLDAIVPTLKNIY